MTHVAHELHDEFPVDSAILHRLKVDDAHFAKLAEQYHVLNREIHRIEAGVEGASDARAEDLKKQRLALLDQVAQRIAGEKARVQA